MPELMTAAEVAQKFGVGTSAIARWAKDGKLSYIVTPGGHRRYYRADVEQLLGISRHVPQQPMLTPAAPPTPAEPPDFD